MVVNNGTFDAQDGEGILSLGDSHKTGQVTDIGRFGFGQKALSHLCDAFVVHALGYETTFSMSSSLKLCSQHHRLHPHMARGVVERVLDLLEPDAVGDEPSELRLMIA